MEVRGEPYGYLEEEEHSRQKEQKHRGPESAVCLFPSRVSMGEKSREAVGVPESPGGGVAFTLSGKRSQGRVWKRMT